MNVNPPASASTNGNPEHLVDRVTIRPPPFWRADPKLWFVQLEAQFEISRITVDSTKYNYVVSAIDTDILTQIADFLLNPPTENKYEELKIRLIDIYSESNEKKLRKLLSEVSLGDKKPSQLLAEMSKLGGTSISQEVFRTLWMQHLPTHIQSVLTTSSDPLEKAKMADKISETDSSNLAAAIEKLSKEVEQLKLEQENRRLQEHHRRSRSRYRQYSRSGTPGPSPGFVSDHGDDVQDDVCWYHRKFKEKAHACKPPCKFNKQENSTVIDGVDKLLHHYHNN